MVSRQQVRVRTRFQSSDGVGVVKPITPRIKNQPQLKEIYRFHQHQHQQHQQQHQLNQQQQQYTQLKENTFPQLDVPRYSRSSEESSDSSSSSPKSVDPYSFEKLHENNSSDENINDNKIERTKRVIQDLHKAIGHKRRIAAISNACTEFDHWDKDRHNIELELGGANMLCLVLSMTEEEDEIHMICAALEMIYRASTSKVRTSFKDVGPAVIPLLLKLLQRCEDSKLKQAENTIVNITKILLYYSRVPQLRDPLARNSELLSALTRVGTSVLNPDSRVLRMQVIANLSNSDDNKLLMMEHEGLITSVLKIAALDLSKGAREFASACLMDIASSPSTHAELGQNEKLLSTLVKLAVTDDKDETREYSITAIQNLAYSKENRSILVDYSNGVVLEGLKKIVSTDTNDKARRRAAGALANLACDKTAGIIASHDGLIDTISRVTTHDSNDDVQKRACLALTKIATSCTPENESFEKIMMGLITAAASPNASGIAAVFRVQARYTSRRVAMARLPGMLKALADMCNARGSSPKDRENAMRAIMHLTNESKNRKILCDKFILDALVKASNVDSSDVSDIYHSAIIAIERLATDVSNRKTMAHHDNLLIAVTKAIERESKSELAGEEITQPRLAKQLLMSLLLAM